MTKMTMNKTLLYAMMTACVATSCKETNLYEGSQNNKSGVSVVFENANSFDFSTVQSVKLTVDYSACEAQSAVFFSIYAENPYEGTEESRSLREDVRPIFEGYTNAEGIFSNQVNLPSYANDLYVVSGHFLVTENLMETTIKDGAATAIAPGSNEPAAARALRAPRKKVLTNSLETLYQLSYEVNVNTGDKTDKQIYKEWATPLGSWDSESGRPDYLLSQDEIDEQFVFTEEEKAALYETISQALVANQACNPRYLTQADLTVEKESEVALSFLGSMTCWNNSLGYYYYDESNVPTTPMDLNIIMLFPNTQDGYWKRDWHRNPNFYGNIGLNRGDAVQLMYYPHIASDDPNVRFTDAKTKFPKGTKIGFILKSNGWGMQKMQGNKKFFNSYNGSNSSTLARQYNVWGTSTDGVAYCNTTGLNPADCKIQNPQGQSRTAKFAYKAPNGDEYAIIGFEDACNDLDYDDIVLALKPADAFKKMPTVVDKTSTNYGVYAFEDLWPGKGDYDMNDAMVELQHEKTFAKKSGSSDYKIFKETFRLTTYQNYVTLQSGLALTLETKQAPSSIVMKKVDANTKDTTIVNYTVDGKTYLLTEDIKAELNSTYILELNYANGISQDKTASVKPFIYRNKGEGRWEVHIPFEAPTSKMITSYFGTEDDMSDPAKGAYYVRQGNYPFAFYLDGITIDHFKETLLKPGNESVVINKLYPKFLQWTISQGTENTDWYVHPQTAE